MKNLKDKNEQKLYGKKHLHFAKINKALGIEGNQVSEAFSMICEILDMSKFENCLYVSLNATSLKFLSKVEDELPEQHLAEYRDLILKKFATHFFEHQNQCPESFEAPFSQIFEKIRQKKLSEIFRLFEDLGKKDLRGKILDGIRQFPLPAHIDTL